MSNIRYLDIDDLNTRLEELEDLDEQITNLKDELDELPDDEDNEDEIDSIQAKIDDLYREFDEKELKELRELRDEIGSVGSKISDDGGPFIHCDDFEEYAQELAEETGAIDRANSNEWPLRCIDWAQAAKELESDYSVLTYGGEDYYYRA